MPHLDVVQSDQRRPRARGGARLDRPCLQALAALDHEEGEAAHAGAAGADL